MVHLGRPGQVTCRVKKESVEERRRRRGGEKERKKKKKNKWIKEKTWGRIEVESSRLSADRASEQTRRFKCIENLRRARNDRNRSRRLHLHSDLDAIRRRDSFVASIVAGRMKLGGIVSSLMERVSLRHFNVGGKCCEGNSSSSYFFFFFKWNVSQISWPSESSRNAVAFEGYIFAREWSPDSFFPAFLGNTRKKKYISRNK